MVRAWFARHLADPQVVALTLVLLVGFGIVVLMGDMLASVMASLVIAYLLEAPVQVMERWHLPRGLAVLLVFLLFTALLLVVFFALVPLLARQVAQLVENLPGILDRAEALLLALPERYPQFFSREQVVALTEALRGELLVMGRGLLSSVSFQSVVMLITAIVYLVLVPFLVFFFLWDKRKLQSWLSRFLPRHRGLASTVWHDVDIQIGNYVRGKFLEIVVVWAVSYATFAALGLQFSMLLAVSVGLSVIVPYVGATVVTLPVALIAYFQWGFGESFVWVLAAYGVIQALDANVLVPLLFSEVVNLHPVAIIVAILVFGGLWGFWGVFFAIPLATLFHAVLKAWPVKEAGDAETGTPPAA